ncbi:MAG: uracil-DNA glycosylase [Planctomycetes bacterium]|nr:uracil-DNA glycosylase [Planctomycetota bacterium]
MTQDVENQVRRIVTQHLESLSRAGLTHLPRSDSTGNDLSETVTALQSPQVETVVAISSQTGSATEHHVATTATGTQQKQSLFPNQDIPTSGTPSVTETSPCLLSLDERREKLKTLENSVAACVRCQELAETRNKTVFGVGNPEAKLMFIGEAPGADEDRQGEPFVGRAGQMLNKIIVACKLTREEIYISNNLKCRPPGNRNPTPQESKNCREYLDSQIAVIDPDYIVCWGAVAAQNLLGMTESIGKMRKKFYRLGRAKVLCTYHPSYLLRNPAAKKDVWEDMIFLMHDMGIDLTE